MSNSTPNKVATFDLDGIGARWASALRRLYPSNTYKSIERDFNAAPGTVKGWLDKNQAPQWRHMLRAIDLHGEVIAAEVCAPDSEWHDYERRRARTNSLKAEIAALHAELA